MLIIGIAGGTGSGKTTVVSKIINKLPDGEVTVISQDAYYKDNSDLPLEKRQELNFDHPDAVEFNLLVEDIKRLKRGETILQPVYSYLTCTRATERKIIKPMDVVIIEGILCLSSKELRELMDIKIFVDCEADVRLSRVIQRDLLERGRDLSQILLRYEKTVRPSHYSFIEPTKRYADIIVPEGGNNEVAIKVISQFIQKSLNDFQSK